MFRAGSPLVLMLRPLVHIRSLLPRMHSGIVLCYTVKQVVI